LPWPKNIAGIGWTFSIFWLLLDGGRGFRCFSSKPVETDLHLAVCQAYCSYLMIEHIVWIGVRGPGPVKKILYIILGTLCVGLGVLGIFLPLMPTTVFLLLAAFFYSRSSDRFYEWLIRNPVFGEYIRNYREGRGMTLRHKVHAITLLWITVGISLWFLQSLALRILLLVIASSVTIFLSWFVKTYRPGSEPTDPESGEALT
jgi:uncharacterized membrane protein YbaN (DUF454 family)